MRFALLLVCLAGAALARADAAELARLVDARLELMDEVAAFKFMRGLPIEDGDREAVVVERAVADALRYGFTVASSRRLFLAQIEAAKAVQAYWFSVWGGGLEPPSAPDLDGEIRPELLRLGEAILAAAAGSAPVPASALAAAIDVVGLPEPQRADLLSALEGLERYPHRLAQILDSGALRVGTTGDYAPFSHRADAAAAYSGIDIDLAHELAGALGVTAEFVATSWPTLMDDLDAGRFDVGMSGISRTVARQRHGFLSQPYYVGGKTPIARCEAATRLATLADIDQPQVRVVVNPGGTNEAFVDAHLSRARKLVHPDNRTIFQVLVDGGADVMITDRVEVELQASRHPALCATMTGTLSYQEKGYLMPQDPVWKAFVDTWLALAIADGTVARIFHAHGVAPRLPGANAPAGGQSNPP